MRSLYLQAPGNAAWREVAAPALETGGALVRPLTVAFCDADRAAARGQVPLPWPYRVGHEFVAEVIEADWGVGVEAGQLVVVPFQISCGGCGACTRGRTGNCGALPRLSMYGFGRLGGRWGGALSDVLHVPFADHMLVPLPDGVSPLAAANASDNLADAWRSVAPHIRERPDAEVLVIGGGAMSIGLWAAEFAVTLGAPTTYVDDETARLELAEDGGARVVEGPPPRRLDQHEITVDASGDVDALAACLRSTSPDGVCTSVSMYFTDPSVPFLEMYSKNATFITGRPHGRATLETMLKVLADDVVDPLRVADVAEWDDAGPALTDAMAPKVIVQRPAS